MRRRVVTLLLLSCGLSTLWFAPAHAELTPGGTFLDDDGSTHEGSIEAIVAAGITKGCDEDGFYYCPNKKITRGQMAALLARALQLPPATQDWFPADPATVFDAEINSLAEAGITGGCNPPENTSFCPDDQVTRGQMATFLARAFAGQMPPTPPDAFLDDNGNTHELSINQVAAAGIALGCDASDTTLYCPYAGVTRQQMAAFLARALGLTPMVPPPRPPTERVSSFTTHFNCCEDRVINIRRMAQLVNGTVIRPGEVFSVDAVVGRLTTGKGFVLAPYMVDGKGECCTVGGGVSQFGTTIFNAAFWGGYEILEHQPHSAWISRYPLGIEATLVYHSKDVKFRNDTYNTLTVKTSTTGTSLTVEIWGNQGGWRVRGNHSIGNRSSAITILDQGGSVAKRVKASVSGSAPGLVTVTRTLTQNGVAHSQSWTNRYLDPDA